VAFRQFGPIRTVDQRDVGEQRWSPTHRVINLHLAERVGQVVVAADHVGDRHVVIVDDDRVQICRGSVASQDDQIVHFGVGYADGALHQVLDHGLAVARGFQPD
jgi:hypothetical protein